MTKYAANGTLIKRASQTVGQVHNIGGPSGSRDLIDVSAHGDDFRDFVVGMADMGEITLDVRFDPSDSEHVNLRDDWVAGTLSTYQLVFPTNPVVTWEFDSYVTGYQVGAPVDGELALSVTLKIAGSPSFSN